MFWDKSYTPSQNIEILLEKENVTVEEFLDEDDILQECKTLKSLVNYFTRPDVIKRLVELITTEPPKDLPMAQRFRYANMACEILTLGLPSLDEKLLSDPDSLKVLYSYLENEPPLHPLLSSFFSKTFSMLFTKKPEQDWFLYQQMCLKLLEYIKSQNNFLDLICKHFPTPVVPDLILQMMRDVDGGDIKRNLYEWLTEEKLVERLIAILGNSHEIDKHENVADFLCDLIEHGRSMRIQDEQENSSFEPAFNGSNPLLENLESETTIKNLINVILDPNAVQGSIVSGITVVLTLMKSLTIVDDLDTVRFSQTKCEIEIRQEILSTVIRVVLPRIKDFNELLKSPPKKPQLVINTAQIKEPFGNIRLQVIRLFRMLLESRREEVVEGVCETDFFQTIMEFFKQYCWNNFLHTEVQKCLHNIFKDDCSEDKSNDNSSSESAEPKLYGELARILGESTNNIIEKEKEKEKEKLKSNKAVQMLQNHVIVECKIISKLLECWQLNRDSENAERKRRLGYMGHLVKIFEVLKKGMTANESLKTLVEENLTDEKEKELWRSIVDEELCTILDVQSRMLANCNANSDFSGHIVTDYPSELGWEGYAKHVDAETNNFLNYNDNSNFLRNYDNDNDFDLDLRDRNNDTLNDDNAFGDESNINCTQSMSSLFNFWDKADPFDSSDINKTSIGSSAGNTSSPTLVSNSNQDDPWANFGGPFDFADFDSHFDSFINDMGESLGHCTTSGLTPRTTSKYFDHKNENNDDENYPDRIELVHAFKDNNANLEKLTKMENSNKSENETLTNDLSESSTLSETIEQNKENSVMQQIKETNQLPQEKEEEPMLQQEEEEEKDDQKPLNSLQNLIDEDDDFDDDEGMWTKPLGSQVNDTETEEQLQNGPIEVMEEPPELKTDIIPNLQLIGKIKNILESSDTTAENDIDIVQNLEKMNSLNHDKSELMKNKLEQPNITENSINNLNSDNSSQFEKSSNSSSSSPVKTTSSITTTEPEAKSQESPAE